MCNQGLGTLAEITKHVADGGSSGYPPSEAGALIARSRKRALAIKVTRVLLAGVVCLGILLGILAAGVWFLVQGRSGEGNVVVAQIEENLESILGQDYDVVMSHADLDLSEIGKIGLKTSAISVNSRASNKTLATISEVRVEANWLEYLAGSGGFDSVTIDGLTVEAGDYGSPSGFGLPPHFRAPIERLGKLLRDADQTFASQGLESIELLNSRVVGPVLGRKEKSPISIPHIGSTWIVGATGRILGSTRQK